MQLGSQKFGHAPLAGAANTDQRLTPKAEEAVSEADVIMSGRPELRHVWGGQVFGFPTHSFHWRKPDMLCFVPSEPRLFEKAGVLKPVLLANPQAQPERERLLHLVIGSPEGVRSVIHMLHKLQYAEQATWSQLITIPESGLVITPEQGEVFSLLRRDIPRAGV